MFVILGVKKQLFILLIVNSSKSLKLNLLIFAVKIAAYCEIVLGVVLMQSQSPLFHNSSLLLKIAFKFRSNPAAM